MYAIHFKGKLSETDGFTLHRYRLRDAGCLRRRFGPRVLHPPAGGGEAPPASSLGFWFWLHRTFRWVYTISLPDGVGRRIIGFIGLYGIEPARDITLAVTIFDPRDRRRGYGRRALRLLLADFRDRSVVPAVSVEVSPDNDISLAFFHTLGFRQVARSAARYRLRLRLIP
jgi:ribosomal protein S18 acetylase RimI-like enzyme